MKSERSDPRTLEEAIEAILKAWPPETLERVRLTQRRHLMSEFTSATREIRNGWNLHSGDSPLRADLAERGCLHGHEMSKYVLEQVWRSLNGLPLEEKYEDRVGD